MIADEKFVTIAGLICEPTRARMLWNLLDGRAYTASELAIAADISPTSVSNHLSKLLEADILKVEIQGRHRYFSFSKPEVAYVIESMANLSSDKNEHKIKPSDAVKGVKYCRTCYDHLAGFVGVSITESLEKHQFIIKKQKEYSVTVKGWKWFEGLGIYLDDFENKRRPITRQCLDWSERRPHLAGQLGAAFLEKMVQRKWFRPVQFSREMIITTKGREELDKMLSIQVQ